MSLFRNLAGTRIGYDTAGSRVGAQLGFGSSAENGVSAAELNAGRFSQAAQEVIMVTMAVEHVTAEAASAEQLPAPAQESSAA